MANFTNFTAEQVREFLSANLPPIIAREKVPEIVGDLVAVKSLQQYDCYGKGPKQMPTKGRKVAYLRPDFINWFMDCIYHETETTNDK